jgi:rubrerythrin
MEMVTLSEVLGMAVEMESNAVSFYDDLAAKCAGEADAAVVRQLADMERRHKTIFEEMRAGAAAGEGDVPRQEGGLFAAALAEGYRVEGSRKVADSLTGSESVSDILRLAVGLEKDAVLFYLGIRDVVGDSAGKAKLEEIIAEEKRHIVTLADELKKLGQ